MVVVVYAAVEFFDVVDYILGHFEMNFPSFEETLRMKHHTMDDDKALWTRYARLLHLQTQFKAGWDEELCFNGRSNLFQATHKKLDEIASWNLKTVDDAKAIVGEAEAHVKELKETVIRDVQGIRRMPDDAEANARQVLEKNAHLSFLLADATIFTGAILLNTQEEAAAIVKKLEKRKRTISDEISKVQDAISDLGEIKEAREEVARFFATNAF